LKTINIDVSEQLEEFENLLVEMDEESRKEVSATMSSHLVKKRILMNKLKNSKIGSLLMRLKYRRIRVLSGFDNVLECSEIIDEEFLNNYSSN
jgi:hypothetical protein